MTFNHGQENKLLLALGAVLALLIAYRIYSASPPKTAPLTYARGTVAGPQDRQGGAFRSAGPDPINIFFALRQGKYPGVTRDIFRMETTAPKPKPKAAPLPVMTSPTLTLAEKSPGEKAADISRAELSQFRFLGYLTEKDNTLFLSRDGELFMVKSGGTIQKSYKIKEAGKDYAVLLDTSTLVEVRIELSGGEPTPPSPQPIGRK